MSSNGYTLSLYLVFLGPFEIPVYFDSVIFWLALKFLLTLKVFSETFLDTILSYYYYHALRAHKRHNTNIKGFY